MSCAGEGVGVGGGCPRERGHVQMDSHGPKPQKEKGMSITLGIWEGAREAALGAWNRGFRSFDGEDTFWSGTRRGGGGAEGVITDPPDQ